MIHDPDILLSLVNTKLRDFYKNMEDLEDDLGWSKDEIDSILNPRGYFYDASLNQYKLKKED